MNTSKNIEKIADKIAEDNMYKSSGVGFAGVRTKQWGRFEELKKKATNQELIILTSHI